MSHNIPWTLLVVGWVIFRPILKPKWQKSICAECDMCLKNVSKLFWGVGIYNGIILMIQDPVCKIASFYQLNYSLLLCAINILQDCMSQYQNRLNRHILKWSPSLCLSWKTSAREKKVTLQQALKFCAPTEHIKTLQ